MFSLVLLLYNFLIFSHLKKNMIVYYSFFFKYILLLIFLLLLLCYLFIFFVSFIKSLYLFLLIRIYYTFVVDGTHNKRWIGWMLNNFFFFSNIIIVPFVKEKKWNKNKFFYVPKYLCIVIILFSLNSSKTFNSLSSSFYYI